MRISTNFTSVNIHTSSFVRNKSQDKRINNNVNFKRIDNSKMAYLSDEAKILVKSLRENLDVLIEKRNLIRNLSIPRQMAIRTGFPDYISQSGRAMFFKIDDKMVSISKAGGSLADIIKIYSTNMDKSDPELFMIEDTDKVVSNVYPSTPRQIPDKIRYMTKEELAKSKVMNYVQKLNDKIIAYIAYMEKCAEPAIFSQGTINEEAQQAMNTINSCFDSIEKSLELAQTKYKSALAITRIKSTYPNFIKQTGPHRYSFKHDDKILYVSKGLIADKNTKFVIKNSQLDVLSSFIVNSENGKVHRQDVKISNITQTPKYLTYDEINENKVEETVLAVCEHLKKFDETLKAEVNRRLNKPTKDEKTSVKSDDFANVEKTKAKRGRKPKQKINDINRMPVKTEKIIYNTPKKGDLLPEFDGKKRREFPKDLKLSEIDELFEKITGQSINEASGTKGNAPIPQPETFKKSVVIKHKEEPKKVETQSKETLKTKVIKKEVSKPTKNIVLVEPSIWGLAKYIDEKGSFSIKVTNSANIDVAMKEIEGIEYISIIKTDANNKKKYFNIDCDSEKLLKTDLTRKPMIKDENVIPYSDSDLKALGLQDDLERVLDELFTALNGGQKTEALPPKIKMLQTEEKETKKDLDISLDEIKDKAKLDAKKYAEVYFNTFVEEFKNIITKKLEEFEKNKSDFFNKFIK